MDEQKSAPDPARAALTRRQTLGVASAAVAGAAAFATPTSDAQQAAPAPTGPATRLYPHESATRATRDLSGLWKFQVDPSDTGEGAHWFNGLPDARTIPVPASWNDIFDDARNYTGTAWYETSFQLDASWRAKRTHLRFGSAVYRAKVWLNGQLLGEHVGGHLPFAFDVSQVAHFDRPNQLVVMVENKLQLDRVPAIPNPATSRMHTIHYPQTTYDFFPYSGLHRPVLLFATPPAHVHDVTVVTTRAGAVNVSFTVNDNWSGPARLAISGGAHPVSVPVAVSNGRGAGVVNAPGARLWSPEDPFLYDLTVELGPENAPVDAYHLKIGVRTIEVRGEQVLLNGRAVFFRGFGKHEDFTLHGRGLDLPQLVRDFELLKWMGANSFRTSHYPYSEEAMMLADQYGFLVIDEGPGVSLVFSDTPEIIEARRVQLENAMSELVERDKNHPCVVMWSIANEPITKPFHTLDDAPPDAVEKGRRFFASVFARVRSLDQSRPVVLVSVQGGPNEWVGQGDIICANSYNGWYAVSGRLDAAEAQLEREIAALKAAHGAKPIIVTEFGADAVAGMHAHPAEMWSEDYQLELIAMYLRVIGRHAFIVGEHPWCFADFRTPQSIMRVGALNHKGVFTRDRKPKKAALMLRAAWTGAR